MSVIEFSPKGKLKRPDLCDHPDAREIGEQLDGYPGGDILTYECPHCGLRWKEEIPQ